MLNASIKLLVVIPAIERNMESKSLHKPLALHTVGGLLMAMLPALSAAATTGVDAHQSVSGLEVIKDGRGMISVQARDVPVAEVLTALSARSGTPIRFEDAKDVLLTASCHAAGLEPVLRCLLGTDADFAFTYDSIPGKRPGQRELKAVKVLASTFLNLPPATGQQSGVGAEPLPSLGELQAQVHAEEADVRARALEQIGRVGQDDPDMLKATYRGALSDPDGDVRAAAINGLAVLDGPGSAEILSSAMTDADASVRLAALDGLEVDEQSLPLIAQALSDTDESVRALAQLRLGIE
jgi:hypothetical protein